MVVPTSPENKNLGMFMVGVDLRNAMDESLRFEQRPVRFLDALPRMRVKWALSAASLSCRLCDPPSRAQATVTYQSRLVRYMSTLTFALPLVFGFMGEQQTLSVPIMNNYYDGSGLVRPSGLGGARQHTCTV